MSDYDVIVVGAGISGLATTKCLIDAGLTVLVLEQSNTIGGLWHYSESGYGVMNFTHINVSKYNYCFSDFPFPDEVPDYPHNTHMDEYIQEYAKHFQLLQHIQFNTLVQDIQRTSQGWRIFCKHEKSEKTYKINTRFVAIATGHHAQPNCPLFSGTDGFQGEIMHSVKYKDAVYNNIIGKRVLVVGIGNSAVDVAVDAATVGRCKDVYISTRSGAWVIPNYIFGYPTDLYACRLFFWLPWKLANFIFECVLKICVGDPVKWGLNPKMHALQTQPTVSATLIHHIQRGNIHIKPNILYVKSTSVCFQDGSEADIDTIVYCTGYSISLPFLSPNIRNMVLKEGSNKLKLYKNVFSPEIGHTMAFIGFVQPASGGILSMSEIQARWFAELCNGNVKLPEKINMEVDINEEESRLNMLYHATARHTIQRDPIPYNDEIASFINARPRFWQYPSLCFRLIAGSCGAAQWRLQGPNPWSGASKEVKKVPVTPLMKFSLALCLILLGLITVLLFGIFVKYI